jgi:RsiW-degrading membrane proteinase PrsW (M82 family)
MGASRSVAVYLEENVMSMLLLILLAWAVIGLFAFVYYLDFTDDRPWLSPWRVTAVMILCGPLTWISLAAIGIAYVWEKLRENVFQ